MRFKLDGTEEVIGVTRLKKGTMPGKSSADNSEKSDEAGEERFKGF